MLKEKIFGDSQLERLYCQQQLQQNAAQLVYVLCVFTASLLLIALNHLTYFDYGFLLAKVSAGVFLTLNILLNIQQQQESQRIFYATTIWLIITVLLTLLSDSQHGLLLIIIANFSFYTLFPFGLVSTIVICLSLSLAQTLAFILLTKKTTAKFVVNQVFFYLNIVFCVIKSLSYI